MKKGNFHSKNYLFNYVYSFICFFWCVKVELSILFQPFRKCFFFFDVNIQKLNIDT